MNNTFNLYDLRDFKAVGSDLVTPWIDDLLDNKAVSEAGQSAKILSYPVEKLLTPVLDIHIAPSVKAISSIHAISEKETSYFTFVLGSSFYALPSLNINEIIKYKTPVSIFSKKPGHLGVINYRNKIAPIYDFSVVAGLAADFKYSFKYTIICIYNNKFFGLSVNEIKNITCVKNKNLIPSASFKFKNSNGISSDIFEGDEGKFYSVIDINSVYNYLTS